MFLELDKKAGNKVAVIDDSGRNIEENPHLFHQKIEVQVVNEIHRNEAGKVINQ
jgi:hypothetical protein